VSTVLKPLTSYAHIEPAVLERARQEGVAIHKMVELDVADDLDVDALTDFLKPRHAAWRSFVADTGFVALASECRMAHPTMKIAGTCDLVGRIAKAVWLIDVKRSLYAGRAIGLQTAGYARIWNARAAREDRITKRGALVLNANGTYRLTEFSDPADDATFLAAITLHKWLSQGN
jgi:hypothetical protein